MEKQGDSLQRERIRLGDLLIKAKLITAEQLNSALAVQKKSGEKLGKVLIEMGVINEKQLCETLGFQLGVSFVDLAHMALDPAIVNLIPEEIAMKHTLIAIDKISNDTLSVAMVNPLDIVAIDDIKAVTGYNIKV
ncbi:MAG: type II secretion system protein GspE, partial [Candidatus Omnitrophica bacterium]|nr:type II secretion system protein GspE [Candidatus Omnitrophota bacterium]